MKNAMIVTVTIATLVSRFLYYALQGYSPIMLYLAGKSVYADVKADVARDFEWMG